MKHNMQSQYETQYAITWNTICNHTLNMKHNMQSQYETQYAIMKHNMQSQCNMQSHNMQSHDAWNVICHTGMHNAMGDIVWNTQHEM